MFITRAARALLVLSLVPGVLAPWALISTPASLSVPSQPPVVEPAGAPVRDARALPNAVSADQEIAGRRTAHSATFRVDADTYTTILSAEALHYRDEHGAWQPIDPVFRARGDSYVVERNSIASRAGLRRAWLSAAVDQTAVTWEATELGVSNTAGDFIPLAKALPESSAPAEKRDGDRALYYVDGWNVSQISEEISSAPDSVEHSLVLEAPLAFDAAQPYLELRARLELLPGATLWAGDRPIGKQTRAVQTLQVRNAAGEIAILFDRVRAFEQQSPDREVAGDYVVYASAEPDTWIIGVRTPGAWWTDRARQYPVVLDPIMRVKRSTGFGDGLAWVGSAAGQTTYTAGHLVLGPHTFQSGHKLLTDYNTQTRGYVQFNSLPAVLTNAPISITAAFLDVEPLPGSMPAYDDADVDWEYKSIQRDAQLTYVGACPTQAACNNLSLHDNRITNTGVYTWGNSPQGTLVATKPLKAGPWKGKPKIVTTTFEVTTQLQDWYHNYFAQAVNRPGPLFMLTINNQCPSGGPYQVVWQSGVPINHSGEIPQCISYEIPPGNVRLRLEYDALPISLGNNPLNTPGVPSYLEGVLADTSHQYKLNPSGQGRWRAIAARGNHALTPGLPARVNLKLWDYTTTPQPLASAATQTADQTAFVLLDDHSPSGIGSNSADLRVEVTPSNENDYPSDLQRNYRLDYEQATAIAITYGVTATSTSLLDSDHLIQLKEFYLHPGDNVLIRATASITIDAVLVEPTLGATTLDASVGNIDPLVNTGFEPAGYITRSLSLGAVQTDGQWAVALINQGPPIACTPGSSSNEGRCSSQGVWEYTTRLEILVCPEGTIPTVKWGCQPLRLPDNTITPTQTHTMPLQSGGVLTIYSRGGFADTNPTRWCTMAEGNGAPIVDSGYANRYVFVAQGSVCRNGNALLTTSDSALGLTVPVANFNPSDKRGRYPPGFIYGGTGLSPVPVGFPDGRIALGDNGELLPFTTTLQNKLPFKQYWQAQTAHAFDRIQTSDMTYAGKDVVNGQLTVETQAAPLTTAWDVPWSLFPYPAGAVPAYAFVAYPITQSQALPTPLNVASADLRMAESGAPDGLVRILDTQLKAVGPSAYQFRATGGVITLDPQLGGTSNGVQVVAQPPGLPRMPGNENSCSFNSTATSCLDLRRSSADYNWANGKGEKQVKPWSLPDVHIEETVGALIYSRPGYLNIFSTDHPNAPQFTTSFSFDTWDVTATVEQASCVANGPPKTVVKGQGYIALPSLGDDGSGPPSNWIKVNFRMCETKLQQAQLEFGMNPPGIPVGSTGLGVNVIGGTVTIEPGSTEIQLDVHFQTLDNTTLTEGQGTVTLNTAGLFSLQAQGKIVQELSADMLLQVAWNPLDMLFDGTVSYHNLLTGELYLHGWIGQGWQHKYKWLDDDEAFHFTGSIEGTIQIPKGELINKKYFKLPPFTLSVSAEVSFGEFCTSSATCKPYAWGLSATVKVFGYGVGVYVDKSGPDLFLGSSSHKLIDQFGPGANAPSTADILAPTDVFTLVVPPGLNQANLWPPLTSPANNWAIDDPATGGCTGTTTSVHECPFDVPAGTGRALFMIGWLNGALDVALIKPDNTVITATNALAQGVTISSTADSLMHTLALAVAPTSGATIMNGAWKVRLSNVDASSHYQIFHASDPPAPTANWITPIVTGTSPLNGVVNLQWAATRGGQPIEPDIYADLFYVPLAQKPVTPTLMAGLMITNGLPAAAGQFQWNVGGLAAGEYAVGLRMDDHLKSNGHIVAWAPGTIVITDTTPPPIPVVAGKIAVNNGLIVTWLRDNATPDLAGYLVEYTFPNWDGAPLNRARRVIPHAEKIAPAFEHVRLGGLLPIFSTTVCVRAYDASNNVSACTPFTYDMPEGPDPRTGVPTDFVPEQVNGNGSITVRWTPAPGPGIVGYWLSYRPARCQLPDASRTADEGASPISISTRFAQFTLSGLTPGQFYELKLQAYTAAGDIGPEATTAGFLVDQTDADGDGIPDQWAALYGLTPDGPDPDGDGLSNDAEYRNGTSPLNADSDGDGHYDAAEAEAGRDPCAPDPAPVHQNTRLTLAGPSRLFFQAATNLPRSAPELLHIMNFGAANMDWLLSASASWIRFAQARGLGDAYVEISADASGLAAGLYSGVVTVTNNSSVRASLLLLGEVKTLPVYLAVLPTKEFSVVYLPLIRR